MDLSNQFRNLKIYIDKIRRSIRFINLLDTPDSYDGKAGYFPKVNTTEDGLEFANVTPGSYSWNMVDNEDVSTVIADGTSVKFEDSDDIDFTVTVDTETPYIHTVKAELKAGVVHTQLHEMDSTSDHKGNVSSLFLTPATPDDTTGHTAVTALSYASVTDGAVLKKYTDGSSNPAMKLEKVKISECTSTSANCMFVSNSSGGITEFGVGATGTILKGNGITSDPSFGTLSTLTRGTGLTGSNYAGFTDTTWAVDFSGTGSATTVSRSDHTHTNLHTQLHAMNSVTDHYASGNKMFCSLDIGGGSTATISEFSLGTSGTFLKSTGVSTVPAFSQIAPSDIKSANQYRIFASDNTQIVQEIAMGNGDAFLISNGASALPSWVTPSEGYMKYTAAGYDFVNETYSLSTHNHSGVYQPLDTDLTSIAALSGTGYLKNTAGTWTLETISALPSCSEHQTLRASATNTWSATNDIRTNGSGYTNITYSAGTEAFDGTLKVYSGTHGNSYTYSMRGLVFDSQLNSGYMYHTIGALGSGSTSGTGSLFRFYIQPYVASTNPIALLTCDSQSRTLVYDFTGSYTGMTNRITIGGTNAYANLIEMDCSTSSAQLANKISFQKGGTEQAAIAHYCYSSGMVTEFRNGGVPRLYCSTKSDYTEYYTTIYASATCGIALSDISGTTSIQLNSNKLGFYGVTPIVKASAITAISGTADSTYSSNEVTLINDLKTAVNSIITALKNVGLTA